MAGLIQDDEAFFNATQNARVVQAAEQFDAMVWIEQTTPVTALPLPKSQTLEPEDETFPFGV
ncbi:MULTISPECIES: hypothetical protein [Gammaproteobacteria]|uniref:Uncharacterized protein n=1 Tax=Pseudomonas lini TaxID=163011 RepID=A0A423IDG8_9PSED|nr:MULTISPECIES: hypothetical protein [Gammaproteobacteria]MBK5302149.1 hypothetical protein [Bacillus sp. TH86]MBK5321918.1 hypothetical protein [Bacillus sp. TH59]MBK5336868.1 hypothetical protein [Bacillus sp. TH57]MBK5310930.1 hypothetical protein [Pseudomonas sp. TH71]MBK5316415.1 hypothetical protein [Erwinia sp. TH79]